MTPTEGDMEVLIEKLAEIEHARWSRWHKHAAKNWNVAMVSRWNQQADTPYHQLSGKEKESDRREVMEYWPLILSALQSEREPLEKEKEELIKILAKERDQFGKRETELMSELLREKERVEKLVELLKKSPHMVTHIHPEEIDFDPRCKKCQWEFDLKEAVGGWRESNP